MKAPFTVAVLNWFSQHQRMLPWRMTKDPYAIWLSEIILQQTRIQQGMDYWYRFMRRWPYVEKLANATEDEVLREWQGLGYYSRARNLHVAARQIVELGHFPDTFDEIRKLKGVGDYTAAAIASIAFNIPVAVVDGNVFRVLARYFGVDIPINTTNGKKTFMALAQELLPADQPAAFNQAMMDFGAVQCTPKAPDCSQCPLMETCDARMTGRVDALPVKINKIKIRERHFSYYYIRFVDGSVNWTAIRKRPAGDIWQGLWEPLMVEEHEKPPFVDEPILMKHNVRHVLTHQVIHADFYLYITKKKPPLSDDFIWVKEEDLDRYAFPRLVEMLLEVLPR